MCVSLAKNLCYYGPLFVVFTRNFTKFSSTLFYPNGGPMILANQVHDCVR